MAFQRTMPYFGMRSGHEVSTTVPKPRGLGRGYHSMSYPSPIGGGVTRSLQKDSAGHFREHHEMDRLSNAIQKLSMSLGNDQLALLQKEVIVETERLSRSSAKLALKISNRGDQIFNDSSVDGSQHEHSACQNRGRYISANDLRRVSRHDSDFGKSIKIPMFWGETVVLYVNWETCWIPMKLLEKIFNCPGVLLGAFTGCFRHSSMTRPDNSVCYNCFRALEKQFHKFLSDETQPIMENLRRILEWHFKDRNGFALRKSSPFCVCKGKIPV